MKASLFYLPSIGSRTEIEAGMAGMRPDLYQRMLTELSEQIRMADDLGYDSVSFTEHHFHIEGFEVSNNPVLLDLYFAMQTKRIRVGQLGIVLPAANPIRVAEDIAMLDHMTGGRANAGFARGYQRRWVDIMAQQAHGVSGALPHQHDAIDAANRAAFEENFQIIKKAWTQEMLTHDGNFWKVPAGETPWTLDTTAKYGKGVENGILKSVGVVPKPLQKTASAGVPAVRLVGELHPLGGQGRRDRDPAGDAAGLREPPIRRLRRSLRPAPRPRHRPAARCHHRRHRRGSDGAVARLGQFSGRAWFEPFGFRRGMQDPKTGSFLTPEEAVKQGYILAGSIDSVIRGVEANMSRQNVEWIFCYTYNSLIPHPKLLKSIERFYTEVMPRFS